MGIIAGQDGRDQGDARGDPAPQDRLGVLLPLLLGDRGIAARSALYDTPWEVILNGLIARTLACRPSASGSGPASDP